MQTQHPQGMQNVYTFFKYLGGKTPLSPFCFFQDTVKFFNLLNAAFTGNYCSNSILNRCLFILQVLYLLGNNREILVGGEAVDAVEEHCPVVVGDQVGVPSLQEFFF